MRDHTLPMLFQPNIGRQVLVVFFRQLEVSFLSWFGVYVGA